MLWNEKIDWNEKIEKYMSIKDWQERFIPGCSTQTISGKHCPEIGIHEIEKDVFLCAKCFKTYKNIQQTKTDTANNYRAG